MNKIYSIASLLMIIVMLSCNSETTATRDSAGTSDVTATGGGQHDIKDDVSQKDVVKIALASPDHSTLAAALKQADLISSLSNAGPFTVFAPTNEAFKKLPAGTLKDLMKDKNKDKLIDILHYHVFVSALQPDFFKEGQTLNMVSGDDLQVGVNNANVMLNGKANIVSSIPAANGIVYVIDEVLLPPAE